MMKSEMEYRESEMEYRESLSKLNPGDDVVLFNRIFTVNRISKLYIFVLHGNHELRFRKSDGYEPGSDSIYFLCNRPRIIPITDELRAQIKLKNDKDLLKSIFSRTLESLDQQAVTEMTARLRVYEK